MQMLAIIGQKGGKGKTTIGTALATAAVAAGKSVALIDLDAQTSAATWKDRRQAEQPAVISCQLARLPHVLDGARTQGADLAINDTGQKLGRRGVRRRLGPDSGAAADVRYRTLSAVQDILQLARNPAALIVINAAPIQGQRHVDTLEAVKMMGFAVCPVVLFHRAAHGEATNVGQTAIEYAPGSKAAEEMLHISVSN
jgi:chromosome partitioning protein